MGVVIVQTLEELELQVKACSERKLFGIKRDLKALTEIMEDTERIRAITTGFKGSLPITLICTDIRIMSIYKDALKTDLTEIPLDEITSIIGNSRFLSDTIDISWGTSNIIFKGVPHPTVQSFTDTAIAAINEFKCKQAQEQVKGNSEENQYSKEMISRIENLETLKNEGIITEQEFMTQKNKILNIKCEV